MKYRSKFATISECGTYRYWLNRQWVADRGAPTIVFVMLNPSTADGQQDDPTIGRCVSFAKHWGCGELVVVNLYALRCPYPEALWQADDPVGDNDRFLRNALDKYERIVCAWGKNAKSDRVSAFVDMAHDNQLWCLGTNKNGSPKHPLYVKGDTELQRWSPNA